MNIYCLNQKNVAPDVVRIIVIANLMVSPAESYVLVHSMVMYSVELIKQNAITGKTFVLKKKHPKYLYLLFISTILRQGINIWVDM